MDGWYILVVVCASYFYNIIIFIIRIDLLRKKKNQVYLKRIIYIWTTRTIINIGIGKKKVKKFYYGNFISSTFVYKITIK